ncbi:MAG: helix-turn-helix domain-containing protein [Chitinophagaceae bacterium]
MSSFFNTIILLGAVQGCIVCLLLAFSNKNKNSNKLLAWLILMITLASFNLYGSYKNWFNINWLWVSVQFLPLVMVMPIGPLIYFYVQRTLDPNFAIGKKQKRHFYAVLIDLVPPLAAWIYVAGALTKTIKPNPQPWGLFIDTYNVYADIPRWLSVSIYVWLSRKYLLAFKAQKQGNLNGVANSFKWLQQFINAFIVFQAIWLLYLIPYVIPKYTDWMLNTFNWYPIYIPMALLIYWLGIKGYIISQAQNYTDKKNSETTNALSPDLIQQAIVALTKTMEDDKLFLNPELNLSLLAAKTNLPQKTISAVLNQHLKSSFNEFINGYRVSAFKEKILDPANNHLTIAGIAQECGFNSQATFQRVFKELTGQSPSAFRKAAPTIS